MNKSLAYHFNLGKQLSYLRNQGVLIIGSGNIVHNLKEINWEPQAKEKIWALQFDDLVKKNLEKRDFDAFLNEMLTTESGRKSHPTLEHYLPLLYILGSAENSDKLQFLYEGIEHSSISMTSFGFY
jgi:4,5-DOPA dioxygenase extradiol